MCMDVGMLLAQLIDVMFQDFRIGLAVNKFRGELELSIGKVGAGMRTEVCLIGQGLLEEGKRVWDDV